MHSSSPAPSSLRCTSCCWAAGRPAPRRRRWRWCRWAPALWLAIVVTALFASAFGYLIQTWVQAHISANRTALILATEPAWALVAAVTLAGQRFGILQAAGAALLMVAIVGHELASLKFEPHVQPAQ